MKQEDKKIKQNIRIKLSPDKNDGTHRIREDRMLVGEKFYCIDSTEIA